ncbi:CBS domain containing-hemolysin-like protein [Actinopolyspora biskrensis]|uniref:CBS domain containing-hemolysin-like protein n=1 Tax=Actinopolyspora biskrensis TaxID=1470178 RepID=A0A852YQ31_9ACTN|nr:hemolysin family protein [Actinopolyspora biskrensis]NYH77374.1 CBS domain containing-hemolysin-like protein [Actinopolyspora biskrensis]
MHGPWTAILTTIAIIAASAVFVSIEFATIGARRTRLEEQATTSRAARAALRSTSEISVLLAGCQLGITACTLALGAITEPAVEHALAPVLIALGLPHWLGGAMAFVLALLLVTFLHLVVGEMAPKSWAIAHPERSAVLLAFPMRGFMWLFRPVLMLLNNAANKLVEAVGVQPVDEVAIEQNPDELRQLVRHSAESGDLDSWSSDQLAGALELTRLRIGDLTGEEPIASVPSTATVADVQAASRRSGHLRILVGTPEEPGGLVHVRDTLTTAPERSLDGLVRGCSELAPDTTVLDALSRMRRTSTQLALVRTPERTIGVVTISDMLKGLFPPRTTAEPGRT